MKTKGYRKFRPYAGGSRPCRCNVYKFTIEGLPYRVLGKRDPYVAYVRPVGALEKNDDEISEALQALVKWGE